MPKSPPPPPLPTAKALCFVTLVWASPRQGARPPRSVLFGCVHLILQVLHTNCTRLPASDQGQMSTVQTALYGWPDRLQLRRTKDKPPNDVSHPFIYRTPATFTQTTCSRSVNPRWQLLFIFSIKLLWMFRNVEEANGLIVVYLRDKVCL